MYRKLTQTSFFAVKLLRHVREDRTKKKKINHRDVNKTETLFPGQAFFFFFTPPGHFVILFREVGLNIVWPPESQVLIGKVKLEEGAVYLNCVICGVCV